MTSFINRGLSRLGLVQPTIRIRFHGSETRKKKIVKSPGAQAPSTPQEMLLYNGIEPVIGTVEIELPSGVRKFEHLGVKIEMIGQVDLLYDRGNSSRFVTVVRELESAGILTESIKQYGFEFSPEKPYETYSGYNVKLRYIVRVTISQNYNNNVIFEEDFAVEIAQSTGGTATVGDRLRSAGPPNSGGDVNLNNPIKMEVGIEDFLHIEFEYNKQKYHLHDVIQGKISFVLVRLRIKHMELAIIRRETSGAGVQQFSESESLLKYELMDGAPVKAEVIPIRLFLSRLDLTPTYRAVNNVFSVKYFVNLVLVDEEDRRYFKQQEIVFWRMNQESLTKLQDDPTVRQSHLISMSYLNEGDFGV